MVKSKYIWTNDMDIYLMNNYQNMSYDKLSVSIGLPLSAKTEVRRRCIYLGIKRKTGRDFNQNYFDVWSPNMSYILGLIAADGTIQFKEGVHNNISIALKKEDREILEKIKKEIGMEKKLLDRPGHVGVIQGKTVITKPYTILQVSSKHACKKIISFGIIPNKTYIMSDINIPDEYFSHFLRGYFDGNGCVKYRKDGKYKYPYMNILTSNRKLMDLIESKIEFELGLNNKAMTISRHERIDLFRLDYTCKKAVKLLDWLYKDADLKLNRKYKIYQEFMMYGK